MNDNFRITLLFCLVVLFSCKDKPANVDSEESTIPISNVEVSLSELEDTSVVKIDSTINSDSLGVSNSVKDLKEEVDSVVGIQSKINKAEKPIKNAEPKSKEKAKKTTSNPKGKAAIKFESELYDFGEIISGDEFDYKFYFTNNGKTPLTIHGASATCGCTVPSYPFIPIAPGEKGYIGVHYNSVGKDGFQKATITVSSNARNEPVKKLYLKGNVLLRESVKEVIEPKDSMRL